VVEAPGNEEANDQLGGRRVLGVDAAGRHGWVGITVDAAGVQGGSTGTLTELIAWAEPVDVVAVDIPIGNLPGGGRAADAEARQFIGPRASSVFPAPPLEVRGATTFAEANRSLVEIGASKINQQSWALMPKIAEAAEAAVTDPRVVEVHPEVSFCELAGKHLTWPKKSWNGAQARRRLLERVGIVLPDDLDGAGAVPVDDVLDAAVAAWSAARVAAGLARTFPDPPEEVDGRSVCIWC
jgi:predicted RNase H-like nuclease